MDHGCVGRRVTVAYWARAACLTTLFAVALPAVGEEPKPAAPPAEAPGQAPAKEAPKPRPLPAQIQIRGAALPAVLRRAGNRTGEGDVDPVFFPADRATMQRLSKAQELLEQKRYGEAVRLLGDILEGPEDFFFQPNREEPIHRSLKAEAQRLIGGLPTEGRASYELQYGATAQQKLDEAVAAGDAAALAEVSRRFFHTKAGYEATNLLAGHQLDHGHPLAAALSYARLQGTPAAEALEPTLSVRTAICWARAGLNDKATEALARVPQAARQAKIKLAGQPAHLPARDEDARAWLAKLVGAPQRSLAAGSNQWAMYRGSASRNTVSSGSSPLLSQRWAVPTSDENGAIKGVIEQLRRSALDQGNSILPTLHPLAVNDYVFMRSLGGLVAIHFTTGKRVWRGPVDESVRQLLEPDAQFGMVSRPTVINGNRVNPRSALSAIPAWLTQRIWDDATYGTLSSDGERVFCVEDLDVGFGVLDQRQVVLANGRRQPQAPGPRAYNRLAAYDIATEGKLKWEAGGPPGESQTELSGAFFLGPPLPLAGWIYALVEVKGEIRLVALDGPSGKLEWSQQLAVLETNISNDPLRRTAGVSPSYSDGVLVCPTSAGAVVALDLTTRSLLWGYQYARNDSPQAPEMVFRGRGIVGGAIVQNNTPGGAIAGNRWADASVTIAEGRVLLTPPESNQIHCLDLLDGKLSWQKPREDGLYLGCVAGNKVVVVGRNSVRALRLADGDPAWPEPLALPAGSAPSGRGFFNGQRYHLPLATAEVAAIDVATGRIVARSKSRTGSIPGNLICYRGAVISQGVELIERFDQRDDLWQQIADKIAASPDDAAALARRGELLLDEGNHGEAIENLERSFKLDPDPRTRELLVDALLEGLRTDFAAHRARLDEIERLIDQPAQQGAFLRLLAAGLQNAGEVYPAFQAYMRIAGLDADGAALERVDNALAVRRDRWVQARLKGLIEAASPDERAEMEKAIQSRFDAADRAAGAAELRKFLAFFGTLPVAEVAREHLADRLIEERSLLEAEQLARRLEQSADPRRAGAATARLAGILETAGRHEEAADYYRRLGDRFGDVVCARGMTGKEIVAALPEKSDVRRLMAPPESWPVGAVTRDDAKAQPGAMNRNFAITMVGPRSPFYDYMTVSLDHQQQALVGDDGFGRERWRVPLRDPAQNNNVLNINPQMNHARCSGHLLLVSLGYHMVAVDSLGGPGGEGAKILWRQDLFDNVPGGTNIGFGAQVIQVPWAVPRLVAADPTGRALGNIGPIHPELACYQRLRNVVAVRPLTGETLWTRSDVEPGSDLFGDEDMIFVVAPGGEEALVLRALDGFELGRRKVPPLGQRMAALGRRVVSWSMENGKAIVRLTDAWDQKPIWERQFDSTAKAWTVDDQAVGVLAPDGHFVLLSFTDGQPIIDEQVAAEPQLNEVYVMRCPDHYVLVANRPFQNRNGVTHQPVPGSSGNPLVNGNVHIFDAHTGKKIATTFVERRGLLLSQPAALPVLTFATQIYNQKSTRMGNVETDVMFLDKRTGRTVHEEKLTNPIVAVDLAGDPARNQIVLKTQGAGIRLTFTGKPVKPPKDEEAAESDAVKGGKAVLRGLQNWIQSGGGLGKPAEKQPNK
ncbi:MAG: PQQ-binding-like beta-propeller repeat protein [Planctomycetia bacterium]|nr:PQQ-binding-like beta-propeller repeat protein [Planctomycetia bacterium]